MLDERHPYAIGTRLRVVAGTITELEAIVTDEGDWLFNPEVTLERSSAENWDIIPERERSDRATLEAAAGAACRQRQLVRMPASRRPRGPAGNRN